MKHRELLFHKAFQEGDGLNDSGQWWLPREAKIFGETVSLVKAGGYELNGREVRLPDPAEMMRGAVLYTDPGEVSAPELPQPTEVDVIVSDSLLAGKRLLDEGYRPAVLGFANRRVPGLGVESIENTQEQSIFRRSDLFMSLYQFYLSRGKEYGIPQCPEQYPLDRNTGGVYSPGVTVFRGNKDDEFALLDQPFRLGIISVPALPYPDLKSPDRVADSMVPPILRKIRTIFRIGLKHGHDALVLGAWGCGDFCCPAQHIALLFRQVMEEPEFRNRYRKIIFAIMDRSRQEGNFMSFREVFPRKS